MPQMSYERARLFADTILQRLRAFISNFIEQYRIVSLQKHPKHQR